MSGLEPLELIRRAFGTILSELFPVKNTSRITLGARSGTTKNPTFLCSYPICYIVLTNPINLGEEFPAYRRHAAFTRLTEDKHTVTAKV